MITLPLIYNADHQPTIQTLLRSVSDKWGLQLAGSINVNSLGLGSIGGFLAGLTGYTLQTTNALTRSILDPKWGITITRTQNLGGDTAWVASIDFGTPKQSLAIDIDSGSSDLLIFDPTCTSCEDVTYFNHVASSTFNASQSTDFSANYADGSSLEGYTALDTVSIGSIAVSRQNLDMVTDIPSGGLVSGADGLMGIAFDTISFVPGSKTPFSNMVSRGLIRTPIVGIALIKSDKATGKSRGGEFCWGSVNAAYIAGQIAYASVTSSNFWGIPMMAVYANGKQLLSSKEAPRAIIDTGSTLIVTSSSLAASIHALVPGSRYNARLGYYTVPCSTSNLVAPNVFFQLAGTRFGVPASDIAWARISGDTCYSGIQPGSQSFTVLGAVFIKNHYIVLDYGSSGSTPRVGFANRTDIPAMLR